MSDIEITKPSDALILKPVELPADHPADSATRQALYARRDVEVEVRSAGPDASDDWVSAQNPEEMVKEVTRAIAAKEARLAATTGGFDPKTGEPMFLVTGRAREALEREIAVLTHSSLPYTKKQAAEIAAKQAALPTAEDRLRAEGAKRARIGARALEIAEEREAEAQAARILASRQH